MEITVVSNAGPLMVFSKLNILPLLKELYGSVEIPVSVYEETVVVGLRRGFPDAEILKLFLVRNNWKPTMSAQISMDLQLVPLDQGEKEAIALAISKNALLLMDEERGRDIARRNNLTARGSLGVLIEGYAKKLISRKQLEYYFQQISERKDIWISPALCRRLLEETIET